MTLTPYTLLLNVYEVPMHSLIQWKTKNMPEILNKSDIGLYLKNLPNIIKTHKDDRIFFLLCRHVNLQMWFQ